MTIPLHWQTIENQLGELFPDVLATLQAPATEDEIARLLAFYGPDVPLDYLASLQHHNGQHPDAIDLALVNGYKLLSIEESIAHSQMLMDLFAGEDNLAHPDNDTGIRIDTSVIWHPRWLPFAENNGSTLIIDLAPRPVGQLGQIAHKPNGDRPGEPFCATYEAWLGRLADALTRQEDFDPDMNQPPHTIWFDRYDLWIEAQNSSA